MSRLQRFRPTPMVVHSALAAAPLHLSGRSLLAGICGQVADGSSAPPARHLGAIQMPFSFPKKLKKKGDHSPEKIKAQFSPQGVDKSDNLVYYRNKRTHNVNSKKRRDLITLEFSITKKNSSPRAQTIRSLQERT